MQVLVSVSGGKDSTATLLLAIERGTNPIAVFADTGHEHPITYEYLDTLRAHLGIEIRTVRADFTSRLATKRRNIEANPEARGITPERLASVLAALQPTGIPFLDMCLWHGRFPWSGGRFCTSELKIGPIEELVTQLLESGPVESWVGVRADESAARANLAERQWTDPGYELYRPILRWTAQQTVDFIRARGVPLNPLYSMGMGRVGCMPCIMASKSDLREMGRRFPAEVARVEEWERLVGESNRGGWASMFSAANDPMLAGRRTTGWGIRAAVDWASTSRGGRQRQLDFGEGSMCASAYGLCE